jgi:hypothetical protein
MAFRRGKFVGKSGKYRLPKRRRGKKPKNRKGSALTSQRQARRKAKGERSGWQFAYMQRNDTLRAIGFASYADYLASATWAAIRLKVLIRDAYACYGCRGKAFQVHHRSYGRDVLLGKDLAPLVAICNDCHRRCEIDSRGNKLSLDATNARLKAIHDRHAHKASA